MDQVNPLNAKAYYYWNQWPYHQIHFFNYGVQHSSRSISVTAHSIWSCLGKGAFPCPQNSNHQIEAHLNGSLIKNNEQKVPKKHSLVLHSFIQFHLWMVWSHRVLLIREYYWYRHRMLMRAAIWPNIIFSFSFPKFENMFNKWFMHFLFPDCLGFRWCLVWWLQ